MFKLSDINRAIRMCSHSREWQCEMSENSYFFNDARRLFYYDVILAFNVIDHYLLFTIEKCHYRLDRAV